MIRHALLSLASAACLSVLPAQAVPIAGQGTWESTLQPRDINGDGVPDAFYDTALDLTWLADANAGAGSRFDSTGYTPADDGRMTFDDAMAFAMNLNLHGVTGWRLPSHRDVGAPGCSNNEGVVECGEAVDAVTGDLPHLFYIALGNKAYPAADYGLRNTGLFENVDKYYYWTGDDFGSEPSKAWAFDFDFADQYGYDKSLEEYAWPVRDGDVLAAPVPEPASLALFGLGLAALGLRRSAARR